MRNFNNNFGSIINEITVGTVNIKNGLDTFTNDKRIISVNRDNKFMTTNDIAITKGFLSFTFKKLKS
ncbi:MAG: hypothetical protein E7A46_00670 [Finegoldia magna]|uniref:hypothetical protein n=1 Tax=Finegoldia magna TaxID=1260 RepID=UPI0029053C3A|nr:hypothetical protein [Finegoldia magna]MDU1009889.1 hypothetical protein [Finegoldia magna]MDU1086631.1 hypothetical protein [Finegoldia magna]MDU7891025.1 hypothetical protein [Finegoldia magna]